MGYEIAAAFCHAGHRVLLVSGPTALDVPEGVDFLPVESAAEMHDAVARSIGAMEVAVCAAAVADYTPVTTSAQKIKKSTDRMTIELMRTPDILGSARSGFGFRGTLVGFAAETQHVEESARGKLISKECDLVVANDVSRPGIGFDSEQNEVLLVYPDHTRALPLASKHELAHQLVQAILELHLTRTDTP